MKKFLSVLFSILFILSASVMAFAAETATAVTIDGYTVAADETVKVLYIDINGEVTEIAEDATMVVLKATGDIIVNGELFSAGANGKVNVQMNLPVAPVAEETAEEAAEDELHVPAKHYAPAEKENGEEELLVPDEGILIGAPDITSVVTANFFSGFLGRIWAYICSIFSFIF